MRVAGVALPLPLPTDVADTLDHVAIIAAAPPRPPPIGMLIGKDVDADEPGPIESPAAPPATDACSEEPPKKQKKETNDMSKVRCLKDTRERYYEQRCRINNSITNKSNTNESKRIKANQMKAQLT
jgi:hypothetical protein